MTLFRRETTALLAVALKNAKLVMNAVPLPAVTAALILSPVPAAHWDNSVPPDTAAQVGAFDIEVVAPASTTNKYWPGLANVRVVKALPTKPVSETGKVLRGETVGAYINALPVKDWP